jgi:iron complex transport system substrate-binding protein
MRGENMGKILKSRRAFAAILLVIVAISVTGLSTYQVKNNQNFIQQSYLISWALLAMGQPRIVSCAPSITEMVFGLGLEDYLVGCTNYCDYPPRLIEMIAARNISNSLNYFSPSLESILALNPSIVLLASGLSSQIQLFWPLMSRGIIPILINPGRTFAEIEGSIWLLGTIFGRFAAAQTLVDAMNTKIITVKNNISSDPVVPRVLFVVDIDFGTYYEGLWTCGNYTFLSEIIHTAGGLNVFYDVYDPKGFFVKSFEEVYTENPDVMIISSTYYDDPTTLLISIGSTYLSQTTAYIEGDIYFVQQQADNIFSRPGPRIAEAVEVLAHLLHPSVFGDEIPNWLVLNNLNYQEYLSSLIPM